MRSIAFILAFLVLLLSILPCADTGMTVKTNKAKSEQVSASKHKDNKSDDDLCPPFCHCGCCASVSIKTNFLAVEARPAFYGNNAPYYLPGSISAISLPIWQPPQLLG
ncbi:DUF6660 family protein [Sediminibacterium ginsengisoli]|uniref:DUF6660 family protein n=1 Tax=Sediminibacterium ginsengisoli TaxID=413434 RepID=UPI002936FD16|nr:DUF6660 family protein [Sediminibacterium ginsengisoli]